MKHFFLKLPLPVKLMLVAFIPLILLVFFAIQIFKEKGERMQLLNNYLSAAERSQQVSVLVDALQGERRYAFGYALRHDFRSELVNQRANTDTALRQLLLLDTTLQRIGEYTFIDSLASIRRQVDEDVIAPPLIMNYYTNAIFRVNGYNNVTSGANSLLQPVAREFAAQKLLSEMCTYLGIVRSTIYMQLHLRQTDRTSVEGLRGVYDIYKSFETEFAVKGSDSALNAFQQMQDHSALSATNQYLDVLFQENRFDTTYTAERWWEVSANGMDLLRNLQRATMSKAQNGVRELYERERDARNKTLAYLLIALVLVAFIVTSVIVNISRQLTDLNNAAVRIAKGETGVQVERGSNDVVGGLARSVMAIDASNQRLAEAADAIGSGRFDVDVRARSESDVLGNAVVRMRDDLKQYARDNEDKLWQAAGLEAVNESLRGEKDPQQLAGDLLNAVADYCGAQVGLLYVRQSDHLEHKASYAVDDVKRVPAQIAFGETLIGQVAQKRKLMTIDQVPDDYIRIRSGAGESTPRQIVLLPMVFNERTQGVLEMGTLHPFEPRVFSFLQQLQPVIGVALHTARNRARMQELLQETQAQAAELQAQHQELENINAELEAQAEKLQASEEELRVQQEELMEANQELEERSRLLEERNTLIAQRNREIQQKAEELAVSTRYKSEFLANMSHELRTPLNSILLLSRLLSENNEKNLSGDQVEYAQVIQSSGQGLLALIDEILDLSKIEAGKMELEFLPIAPAALVHDLKGMFVPLAQDKGLAFEVVVDPTLPSQIETDKMRLEQVLKNLLSNALKFTSEGKVTLNVSAGASGYVRFAVRDTGIGIAPEKQALIFEAFRQADGSTRRKYGGTGLGLSISRELTRLLGGELQIDSDTGKGSTFYFELPMTRQIAEAAAGPPATAQPTRPEPATLPPQSGSVEPAAALALPKRSNTLDVPAPVADDREQVGEADQSILIIEDDTHFARALLDFTRQRGYKGLVAVRGDEGIELARRFRPKGILLDIQLPVKDGWEVMDALKEDPHTRPIPVHMMSSLEARRESRMKGAVDFINKPLAFEQMQDVFRRIEEAVSKDHKKVLIVEENPRHAQALAYFLETFNVNAQISDSVQDSSAALQRSDVDCVILDMGVPDPSAYETLETLKQQPGLEGLPIIVFTGKNLSRNEELRIKQYADSIVVKTAHSYQRILDEVSLFLHLVEEQEGDKPRKTKKLGSLAEVLAGKKILIADDDVRNIFSLSKALEPHGMEVVSATDGREALQQLEAHPDISVVLMDIMMPEMDGYQAMQEIRRKPAFRSLPIIAVTAKAMTGDREKCIQAGASDYISKPVDVDQLLSLLRVWLYA